MTQSDKNTDFDLEALFADARAQVPLPDPNLMQAIMADAQVVLEAQNAPAMEPDVSVPWWQQLWADIGGWPVVTGLMTAGIVGVWMGMSGMDMLPQSSTTIELTDPFAGLDLAVLEG